jgi:DNA-binding NarL/FixJ family response regulator
VPEIVALVTDLIFRSKIDSAARSVGVAVNFAGSASQIRERLKQDDTTRLLVDMGHAAALESIEAAGQHEPRPHIVAFASHVDTEMIAAARRAGADEVLARSAFSARIAQLLEGEL